jgi:hypothetical protein
VAQRNARVLLKARMLGTLENDGRSSRQSQMAPVHPQVLSLVSQKGIRGSPKESLNFFEEDSLRQQPSMTPVISPQKIRKTEQHFVRERVREYAFPII